MNDEPALNPYAPSIATPVEDVPQRSPRWPKLLLLAMFGFVTFVLIYRLAVPERWFWQGGMLAATILLSTELLYFQGRLRFWIRLVVVFAIIIGSLMAANVICDLMGWVEFTPGRRGSSPQPLPYLSIILVLIPPLMAAARNVIVFQLKPLGTSPE